MLPCPTPWWPNIVVGSGPSSSSNGQDTSTLHLKAHQKGCTKAANPTINNTQHQQNTKPTQWLSQQHRLASRAASHQLSQIDFYFFSIPPHGSGAFPGASAVSSFLSSSLRPLFVRLVNARSWFYFPFAGPPAIPMVGAPGNTPEPACITNSGDFYETYLPRLTGQILYRRTSYQP